MTFFLGSATVLAGLDRPYIIPLGAVGATLGSPKHVSGNILVFWLLVVDYWFMVQGSEFRLLVVDYWFMVVGLIYCLGAFGYQAIIPEG